MKRSLTSRLLCAIALGTGLGLAGSGWAQTATEQAVLNFDQLTRNYNLITFGNASFSNHGDTWGPLAVQGNLSLGNNASDIAQQPTLYGTSSDPTLYVGGQLTLGATVQLLGTGYASLPNLTGSWTWDAQNRRLSNGGGGTLSSVGSSHANAANDPRTNPAPTGWSWASLQSSLVDVSEALAAANATGTISVSGGNLVFNAPVNASGAVVFTLDMANFSGTIYDANGNGSFDFNTENVNNVSLNIASDTAYVINVLNATGRTIFGGINFNSGTNNDQLLWNIIPDNNPLTSDTVLLGGQSRFYGSVLAPLIDLGNSSSVAPEGQIVAASYTHSNAELHYLGFDASGVTFSAVPEPSTWGLFALLMGAAGIFFHRHRQRRLAANASTPDDRSAS